MITQRRDPILETPSTHYKILLGLAETLGKQPDAPWQKVKVIVDLCPQLPKKQKVDKKKKNFDNEELDSISKEEQRLAEGSYMVTDTSQEAVIALGYYLLMSEGKYIDKILPLLLNVVSNLPELKWTKRPRIYPGFVDF